MINRTEVFGECEGGAVFERVAPGHFPEAIVREHEARYRWAAQYTGGKRVLDVGCGTAYGCSILSESGARETVGVDRAAAALRYGKENGNPALVCADILALPFRSETFDVVSCFEVIEHVAQPEKLLLEIARVLTVGGVLIVSTPNANRTTGRNPYHLKELLLSELTAAVRSAGLTCIRKGAQHWALRPHFLRQIFGLRHFVYSIENSPSVFVLPNAVAEPSVYLLVARRGSSLEFTESK